jgi:hypothetical protein
MPDINKIKSQPDIFLMLAQNSLTVAKSIRHNFVENTFELADKILELLTNKVITDTEVRNVLSDCAPLEKKYITASFVDGGVGNIEIFNIIPLIVRGGIFRIKEGERDIEKRETFEFFPVLIGDIEGGEKTSGDYSSVIRIIIELSSIIRILINEKFKDVDLIMLHGPLLYRLSAYSIHWFYKEDYKIILTDEDFGNEMLIEFDDYFKNIKLTDSNDVIITQYKHENKINANCFISFLLNKAIKLAKDKNVTLVGVVERPTATEIIRKILPKTFEKNPTLVDKFIKDKLDNFEKDSEKVIRSGRFNDALIFSLILNVAEYTDFYKAKERYTGFSGNLSGFEENLPRIIYSLMKPVNNTLAIRMEMPDDSIDKFRLIAIKKVYEYSKILPNYAFPIGLDVADKFAKVPNWLTEAYKKYILFNFGKLVTDQELNTDEMLRLLQFYYLNQRDFQFRPKP